MWILHGRFAVSTSFTATAVAAAVTSVTALPATVSTSTVTAPSINTTGATTFYATTVPSDCYIVGDSISDTHVCTDVERTSLHGCAFCGG